MDDEALLRLFSACNSIYEGDEPGGAHGLLTRISYEQFPYQESMFEEVSRTHALLVDGPQEVETEVVTESLWSDLFGAPLGVVVGSTFFLRVGADVNSGAFDPTWLERDDLQEIFDKWPKESILLRATQLTSSVRQFKDAYAAAPKPRSGFERFAYNPLWSKPYIELPNGRVLAPQPRLILRTVSPGGLYYPGIARYGEPFARDLGILTQHYVGKQLQSVEHVEVHPEIAYGKPRRMSIDWFMVLPGLVVLFEVKSTRFGLMDRAGEDGFEQSLRTTLDRAIKQLGATSEALDADRPEFVGIPRDRPRIGVVVTAEPLYLANSLWVRDLLQKPSFPTLTASLRDLEHLVSLPGEEIEAQLRGITSDPDRSTWNLGVALRDAPRGGRNAVLDEAWECYPWPSEVDEDSSA